MSDTFDQPDDAATPLTEMSEPDQNEQDKPALPHKRLAIFEDSAGDKVMLGRLTLTKTESGGADAKLETSSDDALQRLKHLIDPTYLKTKTSGQKPLEEIVADIRKSIEERGLTTKDLPDGDFQLELTIDMNTGRIISTGKPTHPYATGPDNLAADMHKALSEMFASIPSKVAEKISAATALGDHLKAAEEMEAASKDGQFGYPPNEALLNALSAIELNGLDATRKLSVREHLMVVAHQLKRMDIAAEQAEVVLREKPGLTDVQKADLEMIIAYGAAISGQVETAMTIFRRLLKTPETLAPESRAWAWRNLSMILAPSDPEMAQAARNSADAFLEAGNKPEAGRSLMGLMKAQMYKSPQQAINVLNEVEALTMQEGLQNRDLRAGLFHIRANRLSMLGDHKHALEDIQKAVELRRDLQGAEAELISSLYLLQQELKALGRGEEANAAGTEADTLTELNNHPHFKLANRLVALSNNFDAAEAEAILAEAKVAKNYEVIAGVQTMQATLTPDLSDTQRIQKPEACLNEQAQHGLSEGAMAPARHAMVQQLFKLGELNRAELWLRKIVAASPIDWPARDALLNVLVKQKKWGDVVILLRHEIERFGEMPGLMMNLGNAIKESGNLSEAVTVLTKAANLAASSPKIKELALQYREEALQSGGTIIQAKDESPPDAPITSEMFERALLEFCAFVKADKRMTFWNKKDDEDYEWIPSPESYAQNLLHTYLKGKFGERINVFEEIKTGAGRIDIYVQLMGALVLVVELKMCGFRYSAPYAASGEEQVLHYLENKNTSLGYLVVFDARLDHNGEKIMPERPSDRFTVKEFDCDVRPRFRKRSGPV